ncbi:MAG: hypothetical protein ABIO86_15780 [Sphingomonas sp.]
MRQFDRHRYQISTIMVVFICADEQRSGVRATLFRVHILGRLKGAIQARITIRVPRGAKWQFRPDLGTSCSKAKIFRRGSGRWTGLPGANALAVNQRDDELKHVFFSLVALS